LKISFANVPVWSFNLNSINYSVKLRLHISGNTEFWPPEMTTCTVARLFDTFDTGLETDSAT